MTKTDNVALAKTSFDASTAQDMSRRGFVKFGLGFSAILGVATLAPALSGCSSANKAAAESFRYLRAADVALFTALLPVIIDDLRAMDPAMRAKRTSETLHFIDGACNNLQMHQQGALRQLLDLLDVGALRWLLTGVSGRWEDASPEALAAFLMRWRASRMGTLNAGGIALTKLVSASYYIAPPAWPAAGYPGPLSHVFAAANHKD